MNKVFAIQRSKLNSSYGGVGSTIDTIDNLSYKIAPFNEWDIYTELGNARARRGLTHLLHNEPRLLARLQCVGFNRLQEFFLTETFEDENIIPWNPERNQTLRMASAEYFPKAFYCPRCRKLQLINEWKDQWNNPNDWEGRQPKCSDCSTRGQRVHGPNLVQVRFVLASMETGKIVDLPWSKIYYIKRNPGTTPGVWDFSNLNNVLEKEVRYYEKKGGSNLRDIYIKSDGLVITMAEIKNQYFILQGDNGPEVYLPIVRSANNIYFPYVMSSVYIPMFTIDDAIIAQIQRCYENGITQPNTILNILGPNTGLSEEDVQNLIDNNFTVPQPRYTSEELFRLDEFNCLTKAQNYQDGIYRDKEDRLVVEKYDWQSDSIGFIKQLYLIRKLNVTSALVAYSRIDKVSINYLAQGRGISDNPKRWYNLNGGEDGNGGVDNNVPVALHPTCEDKANVTRMPVVSAYGEGFFVELDLQDIPSAEERATFLHTYAHLIMKTLEFMCGYPLASMSERLYILPTTITQEAEDKYGFMIYCANGEAGSYGGIVSLFENGQIEKIFKTALASAEDCPNDPICESEGGSCFACVQVPETSCELFNSRLSRNIINEYKGLFDDNGGGVVNNRDTNDNSDDSNGVVLA